MLDPYAVLDVAKSASQDEIKTAFRKKAKACHPDHNQGNPQAASDFSAVNVAYEILSNTKKRKQFDSGDIDATGKAKPKSSVFGGFSRPGKWSAFGFGRGKTSGSPKNTQAAGNQQTQARTGKFETGSHEEIMERIFGQSFVRTNAADAPGIDDIPEKNPATPQSDVYIDLSVSLESLLDVSKRTIGLPDGRSMQVQIPRGAEDGRILRLRYEGNDTAREEPADVIVTVRHLKHQQFRVDGLDLIAAFQVSLKDAINGAKLPLDTLDGRLLITIPPWSGSDKVLRVAKRGLPDSADKRGDLLIHLRLMLPDAPDAHLLSYANAPD